LAKPFYEKYIELALADSANAAKYRDGLIECYEYLGNFYALKNEFSITEEYLKKILELNPVDEKAKKGLKMIKEMREGKKAPQK
jgi:lipoprotein NlpI